MFYKVLLCGGHLVGNLWSWVKKRVFSLKYCTTLVIMNSLPNNKLVDWSNLKAFADDKIYVTEKNEICLGRVENIMEKGENGGF